MAAPGMSADLSWAEQAEALTGRVRELLPQCLTVEGMESLDFAQEQPRLLPAAYVCWAGDTPEREGSQGAQPSGQIFERHWLVFLVLELTRESKEALALVEPLVTGLTGWRMCRGMQRMYWRGARFVARFDQTKVIYAVRFAVKTAIKP